MRTPTGLTWAEHTTCGEQLKRFWFTLNLPPLNAKMDKVNRRIDAALDGLRHELDEFVFKDCPEHERCEKCDVYFGWRERSAPLSYADAVDILFTLRDRLVSTNPKNVGIKHIDTIIKLVDENGLRQIPVPSELPESM